MSNFFGWFPLALVSALGYGGGAVLARRLGDRTGADARSLVWWTFLLSGPWLAAAAVAAPPAAVAPPFWPLLLVVAAGNAVSFTLFYGAILRTDVSLALPLVSLTPVFMLGTSTLLLGERPAAEAAAGVLLSAAGTYLLGLSAPRGGSAGAGPLEPWRALVRDRGARDALLVAAIWSVTGALDKVCVRASSSAFYAAAFTAAFVLLYAPLVRGRPASVRAAPAAFALLGLLHAAMALAQFAALETGHVAYVIGVKRAGALVPLACAPLLGERVTPARLLGAALTVAGVLLVGTDF